MNIAPRDIESDIRDFPGLTEKFIVDFANGIEVVSDHLRVESTRGGLFSRLYDHFSGTTHRRNLQVTQVQSKAIEHSLTWLSEQMRDNGRTKWALGLVQQRVTCLREDLNDVAHLAVDTRKLLDDFLESATAQFNELTSQLVNVDMRGRADLNLQQLIARWERGKYLALPPLQRIYVAMDELYWNEFGDFQRTNPQGKEQLQFLSLLEDKLIGRIRADSFSTRASLHDWRQSPPSARHHSSEAVAYLGDWSNSTQHPFSHVATQPLLPDALPPSLPFRFDAQRAVSAISSEIFHARAS